MGNSGNANLCGDAMSMLIQVPTHMCKSIDPSCSVKSLVNVNARTVAKKT